MVVWIAVSGVQCNSTANTLVFCFLSPGGATSRVQTDMTPAGGRPACGCGCCCGCGGGRDADAVSGEDWERVRSGGDNSGRLSPGSDVGEIRPRTLLLLPALSLCRLLLPLMLLSPPLLGGLSSLNDEEDLKSSFLFHLGEGEGVASGGEA